MTRLVVALLGAVVLVSVVVEAGDEGMWTFNNLPRAEIQKKYGVTLSDAWVRTLQTAVVRLESGCTGTFVSGEGLVLTNHHCVQTCLDEHSTPARDLVTDGYQAASRADELQCQGEQASVLVATQDVTAAVTRALANVGAADLARVRNQTLTALESQCEAETARTATPLKCETVMLYQGGQYWLYKYKRYDDVRLAFAPEASVAAFGGDPDNFQFPRWCLDFSLLRVYEQGKPAVPASRLPIDWTGPRDGEPVFVAGHPGTTQRQLTADQLRVQREEVLPFWLLRATELRGRLLQFSKTSPEAARAAKDYLDGLENGHKVRRMEFATLLRDPVIDERAAENRALLEAVRSKPDVARALTAAFEDIRRADAVYREILQPYTWIAAGAGFNSDLFGYARWVVRAAEERGKPNADRLREFTDARLPAIRGLLVNEAPVAAPFEEVRLSFSLERMREYLGPDHPIVRRVLGSQSPDGLAHVLVSGTSLGDAKTRLALFDGAPAAVAASTDPMIVLARAVEPEARALRLRYENEVTAPIQRAQQVIADARFAAYGASRYPDATFTLRLSYGAVDGWIEQGSRVEPFTRLDRLYARTTGSAPFALPQRWLDARARLDPATPVNFSTTNDIVGGNSGSAVVNAAGAITGLIFDGNIHSIAGSYWFDAAKNRAVAVHPAFIRTALADVYGASDLAAELGGPGAATAR